MADTRIERIHAAADFISKRIGGAEPLVGIVLGSGLGVLAEQIDNKIVLPYRDVPGFPASTAIGHKGNFIFGTISGKPVIAMQGRFHYYEGYTMELVTIGIRVMKVLGIKYLFVSNASGGCNPAYRVGDLVIITDHINMLINPLIGPNMDEFGPRFPDMTCAYDHQLIALAEKVSAELGIVPRRGIYCAGSGPSYETPAEVRFYHAVGADLVGMSTIPEVIVARHCGLPVFGMSVVTNVSNMTTESKVLNDGDDVVRAADAAAAGMSAIFRKMIENL
ncbi:MAG: purine-nucleoside phosphorylase [Bacteroidales bacterium]|nr:purine-nucleoside phosphorylase [Bacteroidales bacterium]